MSWIICFKISCKKTWMKKKSECKPLHIQPWVPASFSSPFLSQISLSFPLATPQRGTTVHLFLFESAFKYLLNELTSFNIELFTHYLSFFCHFVVQVFVERAVSNILSALYLTFFFLPSSRSSICLIKIPTRMLEKIPEQHDSSRHVHLVSFCSTQELPLFLSLKHATSFSSSIFLPSSSSLIFPSQVSSTRELPLSTEPHLLRRRSRDTRDKKFLACIRLSALPWISFPIRC